MSGKNNSGLRKFATITAISTAVIATIAVFGFNQLVAQPKHIETAKFLHSKFVEGQFIEGFTPGAPEYGFSLEALSQLQFASSIDTSSAKQFLLEGDTSFLYSADGELITGLAGKFLFTSKVAGAANQEKTSEIAGKLNAQFQADGAVISSYSSTFDFAWAVLGLYANGDTETASAIATKLATLAREDGGFGFDQSESTVESSTDATSMALMALELTRSLDEQSAAAKDTAIKNGIGYLESTLKLDHWVAFEADDVNGTALALMALTEVKGAVQQDISKWLGAQVQSDGGIGSPWVEGAGDVFATAQGYLALEGKTYLDLIGH